LPFLVEKSTVVLKSVSEAMNYVVSQLREDLVRTPVEMPYSYATRY